MVKGPSWSSAELVKDQAIDPFPNNRAKDTPNISKQRIVLSVYDFMFACLFTCTSIALGSIIIEDVLIFLASPGFGGLSAFKHWEVRLDKPQT